VADVSRRAELGLAANGRYLEALGVVGAPAPTRHLLDPVSQPVTREGRAYRALRPIAPDESQRFAILLDGEFLLQGFATRTFAAATCLSLATIHQPAKRRLAE
jgi:hypothetical protein